MSWGKYPAQPHPFPLATVYPSILYERLLGMTGYWPIWTTGLTTYRHYVLYMLCSYSSQAEVCFHREKFAITCNSNTIIRLSKQIYKCKKLCSSYGKYLDWFQIPLPLQKLCMIVQQWLTQARVNTYSSAATEAQTCQICSKKPRNYLNS